MKKEEKPDVALLVASLLTLNIVNSLFSLVRTKLGHNDQRNRVRSPKKNIFKGIYNHKLHLKQWTELFIQLIWAFVRVRSQRRAHRVLKMLPERHTRVCGTSIGLHRRGEDRSAVLSEPEGGHCVFKRSLCSISDWLMMHSGLEKKASGCFYYWCSETGLGGPKPALDTCLSLKL